MIRIPKLPAAAVAVVVVALAARAGEVEKRTFAVTVDNKPAGEFHMAVQAHEDGVETLTALFTVQYRHTKTANYRRTYHGTETWKAGKLIRFDGTSDDDGRKREITAAPAGKILRVTVNGQRADVKADAWTTSLLRLPEEGRREKPLPLLDVTTGKEITGKLEYVGTERLTVFGQTLDCNHYRVRAEGVQADVWYDGADRLVRQDAVENGRQLHYELIRVQR